MDEILKIFKEKNLIKVRGPQRTASTHVLATVRELHQLEIVGETLRYSLNVLSLVAPDWLDNRVMLMFDGMVEKMCLRMNQPI